MIIPDKVKVGGITYDVIFTNEPHEAKPDADGAICYHKQEIRLKPDMAKEYTEVAFLHELIHAITNTAAIDFGDNDEEITDSMAHVLHQILQDNKL